MFLFGDSGVVVKEATKKIKSMIDGFNYISHTEVVVGITEESNAAREDGVTNSQLLYLHENGIPSHNIPPRPVLKPAIGREGTRDQITDMMKQGLKQAILHGNKVEAEKSFHKAGMLGRDACKNYIVEGTNLAPNAPETIRRKLAKGKDGSGDVKPLIDTGSMLNSITYAVRRKK